MDPLNFFARRCTVTQAPKKQRSRGGWRTSNAKGKLKFCGLRIEEMNQFNELCMIVTTNRESNPHLMKTTLKIAKEEDVEEHVTKILDCL